MISEVNESCVNLFESSSSDDSRSNLFTASIQNQTKRNDELDDTMINNAPLDIINELSAVQNEIEDTTLINIMNEPATSFNELFDENGDI